MAQNSIAKNTILLYFRTLCTIIISLYTSRIVLQVLGVNDYGIYQVVGGISSMLSYVINGSLASGSSRFITFEMGKGERGNVNEVFSSLLTIHIIIGIIVILLSETIGLWFVCHKLVIPSERLNAALFTFQFSILTTIIGITQVPYTAIIIGHEKMNIYAYTSIIEAILKLIIVYLLSVSGWDKLILYSALLFIVQLCITSLYRIYCVRNYKESHYHFKINKVTIKKVLSFSTWNLIENTSISLNAQGTSVLLNMFFSSGVVTARSIANIISMTANNFINNLRTATNPQIVKRFSSNDLEGSKRLLLNSTKYSYYMMLMLAIPIFMVAQQLLYLWLGQVPEYSVIFLKFTIITALFSVFDQSFYTAFTAKGQIKETTLYSICIGYITFPITYVLFKLGFSPIALCWTMLASSVISSIIIKPILLIKIIGYKWSDLKALLLDCLKITMIAIPIPTIVYIYKNIIFPNNISLFLGLSFVSIVCTATTIWAIGIDHNIRLKIIQKIKHIF